MPLQVLAAPGCDATKDDYLDGALEDGDVVISVGRIFESLTGSSGIPSENPAALRLALGLRTTAIRAAREKQLSGFILTSNGSRTDLEKLRQLAGADEVKVLAYTEAQACAKIRALVPAGERRAACELGIKARWFGRYTPAPGDRQIRPRGVEDRDREVEMRDIETVGPSVEVEIREADGGARLVGTILQEGRAASVRAELFTPGAMVWADTGISIRTAHRGAEAGRAIPVRSPTGEIQISAIATPEIRAAFASGKRYLSAEFQSLAEIRSRSGVREIQKAYLSAGALVRDPEYVQARAEVRQRASRRRPWL